jgi:hypothetical protein
MVESKDFLYKIKEYFAYTEPLKIVWQIVSVLFLVSAFPFFIGLFLLIVFLPSFVMFVFYYLGLINEGKLILVLWANCFDALLVSGILVNWVYGQYRGWDL